MSEKSSTANTGIDDLLDLNKTSDAKESADSKSSRTVSSVVIDLEGKVDLLTRMIYSNDINSKLTLDRLNKIAGSLEKLVKLTEANARELPGPVQSQRQSVYPATMGSNADPEDDFPSFRPQIEVENPSVLVAQDDPGFSMSVETSPVGIRRTARPETYHEPNPLQKKVTPVFQRVFDETGKKMIFMADVEILRAEDGSVITKTRTTAAGKWQAPLPPGRYQVNIMKRENAGRPRIKYSNSFEINESEAPIELEAAKLI